ncbi:MAG: TMEM175 family protein [Pseudomonadota bacterium]
MPREGSNRLTNAETNADTHGAERGLDRFEGFSDAVFAIALTLLIVEIKVPGSPDGPQGYSDLARAMAEQWREHLALVLCYVVIGAYWLQHHYSGRIYAKTDHWFGAINLLFLLAIVAIPYPIRAWCFHLGTPFEPTGSVTLAAGLALTACTWMAKWFYAMPGRRVMDQRLAPDFLGQMTRRYGIATLIQIAAVPVSFAAPRVGVAIALLCVGFFLLPQPKPRYKPGEEPDLDETSNE